jgi:hypothetical protein
LAPDLGKKVIVETVSKVHPVNPFAKSANTISFRISPQKIIRVLSLIAASLVVAGIAVQTLRLSLGEEMMRQKHLWWLMDKFDLDGEFNVPNLYQTLTFFLCVGLLVMIASAATKLKNPFARHWWCLAGFFLYLALDEGVELHEMTIQPLRAVFGTDGYFYYAWVLLAVMVVPIVGALYLRFLWNLPTKFRWLFIAGGGIFITGAAVMEMVGGHIRKVYGLESLQYVSETVVEESLEMIGILIFIYALLSYLSHYVKEFQVQFFEPKS